MPPLITRALNMCLPPSCPLLSLRTILPLIGPCHLSETCNELYRYIVFNFPNRVALRGQEVAFARAAATHSRQPPVRNPMDVDIVAAMVQRLNGLSVTASTTPDVNTIGSVYAPN